MSDIPAEKQGTDVSDTKDAAVAPKEEVKAAPGTLDVKSVDINLGNVSVLQLKLLQEIRDEIRALRIAVTMPRPMPNAPQAPAPAASPAEEVPVDVITEPVPE